MAKRREADQCEIIVCRAGNEHVGFFKDSIEEVVMIAKMAALPETPPWFAGVLTLRGDPIPVIDLLARIERRERKTSTSDLILVCQSDKRRVGLIVQEVHEIAEISSDAILDPPAEIPHAQYLIGIVTTEENTIQLFSISRLVSLSDLPEDIE